MSMCVCESICVYTVDIYMRESVHVGYLGLCAYACMSVCVSPCGVCVGGNEKLFSDMISGVSCVASVR